MYYVIYLHTLRTVGTASSAAVALTLKTDWPPWRASTVHILYLYMYYRYHYYKYLVLEAAERPLVVSMQYNIIIG
jgi:hypothetical protein